MASNEDANTFHANTMTVYAGNEVVAEAVNVRWRESAGMEPIHTISKAKPWEHLPGRWSGSLEVEMLTWRKGALKKYRTGDILKLPTLDFIVKDKTKNERIWAATGCSLDNRSSGLSANQKVQHNLSFMPLDITSDDPKKGTAPADSNPSGNRT